MPQDLGSMEQRLSQAVYMATPERALSDKVLALKEIEQLKDIVKRDKLELGDLRELSYLLGAAESKLLNIDEKQQWLLGKWLTWINQVTQLQETNLKNIAIHKESSGVTPLTKQLDVMIFEIFDEEIKKMVNIFLFLSRSSLSIRGGGFESLLKQKFEYEYRGNAPVITQGQQQGQRLN